MAEIEQARVFKEIVAARFIRRTVYRDVISHAPAQGKKPLHMIHVIVGQQKLLKLAGREVIHQRRDASVEERYRVVKFHHRATGFATMGFMLAGAATGRAVAAKNRYQLRTTGAGESDCQAHSASLLRWRQGHRCATFAPAS